MQPHIIDAVVANARKHEHLHGTPSEGWDTARDLRYLRSLMEEVGELAAALKGKHEHPMELEVVQIAGICLNWLGARGTSSARLREMRELDSLKHPDTTCPHGINGYLCDDCNRPICNLCGLWALQGSVYCSEHKEDHMMQARGLVAP